MGNSSASERNKQDVALLIAKQFVEFWFGNFVSFKWWNELWLQEAIGFYQITFF
jgi:aminopeptidase N